MVAFTINGVTFDTSATATDAVVAGHDHAARDALADDSLAKVSQRNRCVSNMQIYSCVFSLPVILLK